METVQALCRAICPETGHIIGVFSMSPGAIETDQTVGLKYAQLLFMIFAGLAVTALLLSLGERLIGARIALGGHSIQTQLHEIIIGGDVLDVPQNMIRLPEQRRSGPAGRLDLYLSWPGLSGFNLAEKAVFNGTAAQDRLIFLSFEERVMSRDMSGRYEPIYKYLIEGAGANGPAGLTRHMLPAKAGYLNEVLYVGELDGAKRFVARCSEEEKENLIAACERDVQVGGNLSATLRFPAGLLGEWRALDAAFDPLVAKLIRAPAKN
jgi:hypothetical protein